MQGILFEPDSDWKPPRSVNDLPRWAPAKRAAVDLEARDDSLAMDLGPGWMRSGTYTVGFGFMLEGDRPYYLPIRHLSGGNMNPEEVIRYMVAETDAFTGDVLGANNNYDRLLALRDGIKFPRVRRHLNLLNADVLCWEWHRSYRFNDVLKRRGIEGKNEELLKLVADEHGLHPKRDLWKFHSRYVGPYAERDVEALFALSDSVEAEIDKLGLRYVWDEIETPFIDVCYDMTRRGIRVHPGRLEQIRDYCIAKEGEALARFKVLTGVDLPVGSVWKADVIARGLEAIGIKVPKVVKKKKDDEDLDELAFEEIEKDDKGKVSVDQTFLKNLKHPAADAIIDGRKVNKVRTTYVQGIIDHMVDDGGGMYRVHATYNQLATNKDDSSNAGVKGVRGARTSADHPNVQNQVDKTELCIPWRTIWMPEEGCEWGEADYAAQEFRLCVDWACRIPRFPGANILGAPGAIAFKDAWNADPMIDPHTRTAGITGLSRGHAKNCGFAIMYGAGDVKICAFFLKLPTRWAVYVQRKERLFAATREEAIQAMEALGIENSEIREVAGEEARKIIDAYRAGVPFIGALTSYGKQRVYKVGYIQLLTGRRLNFPRDFKGKLMYLHAVLNRLVQNSAADMSKEGTIRVYRRVPEFFMQAFIHDSVGGSVPPGELGHALGKRIVEALEDIPGMIVRPRADWKQGSTWGEKEAA